MSVDQSARKTGVDGEAQQHRSGSQQDGPEDELGLVPEYEDEDVHEDLEMAAHIQATWELMFDLPTLRELLRQRGLYPDDVPSLIRYAALGLTLMCWRNTVLEDWHAGSAPMSDADMMMENARTSVMAREALVGGLDPGGEGWLLTSADALSSLDYEYVGENLAGAFGDFYEEAFDPLRQLTCGLTLAELGRDDLGLLLSHADQQLGALAEKISEYGAGTVLAFLALKGKLGCTHWFGSWEWPERVDAFVAILRDHEHSWWHEISSHSYPAAELAAWDLDEIRDLLLTGPGAWGTELLDLCIRHGIGYVHLPDHDDAAPHGTRRST